MPAPKIDYRRASILRASGMTYDEIAKTLGVSKPSLANGMRRRGDAFLASQARQNLLGLISRSSSVFVNKSSNIRLKLASGLEQAAELVALTPPQRGDLENTPERQGRAAVLKTLVDASSTLFNWEKDSPAGLVDPQALYDAQVDAPIDVASTSVDTASPVPEQLAEQVPAPAEESDQVTSPS